MAVAWVVEILGDGRHIARGLHDFVSIPAQGKRVSLAAEGKLRHIFGVVMIEHAPQPISDIGPSGTTGPLATIYVQWIAEDDITKRPFL